MITDSPDGTQGDLESSGGSPITEILNQTIQINRIGGIDIPKPKNKVWFTTSMSDTFVLDTEAFEAALKAWIDSAIGKDEEEPNILGFLSEQDDYLENRDAKVRNQLRAELRRKFGLQGDKA